MRWLILALTVACNIGANTLLKAAMQRMPRLADGPALLANVPLVLGILLSGATLVLYTITLRKFELSIAYPVVTGLALLGVFVSSAMLFGEEMAWPKVTGAILIVVGAALLCSSAPAAG
jgi:multidrug transporter EmrE-like cation transporter